MNRYEDKNLFLRFMSQESLRTGIYYYYYHSNWLERKLNFVKCEDSRIFELVILIITIER
jgi:hypothetical protein